MSGHTIVTMPGDGIGNQVLPEALRVLNAVGLDAEYVHADIGWECRKNNGSALAATPPQPGVMGWRAANVPQNLP